MISDKEYVLGSLAQLPDVITLEEIADHVSILAAIRRGEQAADAGRLVPHSDVKRWIAGQAARLRLAAKQEETNDEHLPS